MEQPCLEFCATERKILNRFTDPSQPTLLLIKVLQSEGCRAAVRIAHGEKNQFA